MTVIEDGALRVTPLEQGAIWQVSLATPKANIIDMEKIEALTRIFRQAREETSLKAIVFVGDGPHFSFGASVEDHLPGRFETMIPAFHRLFGDMLDASVMLLAAVRGQCLGGGLELVSFCHRVFAAPDSRLGQPEIMLGVFAPIASVVLAERIGRSRAEDLCLSGRSITAEQGVAIGLVDEIAAEPLEVALDYARKYLLPRSASSLRLAARAVRLGYAQRFRDELANVERLYLEELMTTRDANEGLQAFLDKRQPVWSDS